MHAFPNCAAGSSILVQDLHRQYRSSESSHGPLARCGLGSERAAALAERGVVSESIASGTLRESLLNNTLGFSKDHRDANCRRNAFAAQVLARHGVVAIVSAVSPYRATREAIRDSIQDFVEVHVATPKEACVDRDTKGLWAKALAGEIRNFTGVDDPYEAPTNPEIVVDASQMPVQACTSLLLEKLVSMGLLSGQ